MSVRIILTVLGACSSNEDPEPGPGELPLEPIPTCTTDLEASLGELRVPGLSAAVLKDGRLLCTAVAGSADLEADRPVAPETLFAWASVSKTVTGTAMMMLYDDGRFQLDDDIDPFLPFVTDIPDCPADPVTFRQLLTHTSSIVDNGKVYSDSYTVGDSPEALGDFLAAYLVPGGQHYDPTKNFAERCPGGSYHYSNVGAGLIGHLVEEISGTPFAQFCEDRIFGPLGMDETAWKLADLDEAHIAMPYRGRTPETFAPVGHIGFPTYPDGLLRTSVPQLARFLEMFIGFGERDGVQILATSTAEEMRRAQVEALDPTQGLIWYYDRFGGRTILGHEGDDPGTSSLMFFDPDDDSGAILVANGYWYNQNDGSPEANALLTTLFDEAASR